MAYKTGTDKMQLSFEPMCLDDLIAQDNVCRVIAAFTKSLDMVKLGYEYAIPTGVGNRPYDPRMMLNLYIYGYLIRVTSSRRLEAETHRNIEVMWLMSGLKPDDKTIANFRKNNTQAIRDTFRAFSIMLRDANLYDGEVLVIDGTKIRANNSRKKNHNKTTVEKQLTKIDNQIDEFMTILDEGDSADSEDSVFTTEEINNALEHLKERKEKFEDFKTRLESESEISTTDPDSRLMHSNGDARKLDVCYNVQTVVDSKNHLIVDFEVINSSEDKGNLYTMSEASKEIIGVETTTLLADKGYYDGADICRCENAGTACLVAKPKPGGRKKEEGYTRNDFVYDKTKDCYLCPCKIELKYMHMVHHSNGNDYRVYANYSACGSCTERKHCTTSHYRSLYRPLWQDTLDIADERKRKNKALYRMRQSVVEHPFGTVKAVWGYRQYLCRTKPKVTAETALAYLAYNLRRFMSICKEQGGSPALLSAFFTCFINLIFQFRNYQPQIRATLPA